MKLKAIWEGVNPYFKIVLIVSTILFFFGIYVVVGSAIALSAEIPLDRLQQDPTAFTDADSMLLMKLLQAFSSIFVFLLPALFLAVAFSQDWRVFLKLGGNTRPHLVSVVLMMVAALPAINLLAEWNNAISLPDSMKQLEETLRALENKAAALTEVYMRMEHPGALLTNLFIIALLPAVAEEFFFRGLLQRVLGEWSKNKHVGIWFSAMLFSAMHMQFFGFFPRMLLGALFGYLLVWTGTLWVPVFAHFFNNASAVIAYYLFQHKVIAINPDQVGTGETGILYGLLSLILTIFLIRRFYQKSNTIDSFTSS